MYSNLVLIPILGTNKYLSASISGVITSLEQLSKEEIINKFGEPDGIKSHYCDDFNQVYTKWNNKHFIAPNN